MVENVSTLEAWLQNPHSSLKNSIKFTGLDDLAKSIVLTSLHQVSEKPVVAIFSIIGTPKSFFVDNNLLFSGLALNDPLF